MDLNGIKAALRHAGDRSPGPRRAFNRFVRSLRGGEARRPAYEWDESAEFQEAFCASGRNCERTFTLALAAADGTIVWPRNHGCEPLGHGVVGLSRGRTTDPAARADLRAALQAFREEHGARFDLLPLVFQRGICRLKARVLKPHQIQALCRFAAPFAHGQPCGLLLAHFMGTGKTLTSIACLTFLKALVAVKGGGDAPVVVVTPDAIRGSFVSEWRNWTLCHDLPEDCGEDLAYQGVPKDRVNVFGYAEVEALFRSGNGDRVARKVAGAILVLDETHNLVRQRDRAVRENWHAAWAEMYDAYASAGHVLCLTGTPVEKDAKDIVPLLNLVTSVREGRAAFPTSLSQFRRRFETPITKGLFVRKFLSPVFNTIPAGAAKDFVLETIAKKMGVDGSPLGLFTTLAGAWAGAQGLPAVGAVTALAVARMAYMNVYMLSYTQPLNSLKLYDLRAAKFARVAQAYVDYANFEGRPAKEGESEFPEKIMAECPKAPYNLYQMAKVWSNAFEASEALFSAPLGMAAAAKDLFLDLAAVVYRRAKGAKNLHVRVLYGDEVVAEGSSLPKVKAAVRAHHGTFWLRRPAYTVKVFEQKFSRRRFLRALDGVALEALEAMGRADLRPSSVEFVGAGHPLFDAVEAHVSAVLNRYPAYGDHVAVTPEGRLHSTSPLVAQELQRVFSYNPATGEELALVAWDQDERRTKARVHRLVGGAPPSAAPSASSPRTTGARGWGTSPPCSRSGPWPPTTR